MIKSALLCLTLLTASASSALAIDYYVSPTGNDANAGTANTIPFATIQKGIDTARKGDTIYLAPGIYRQDFITKFNASKDQPITITGPREAIVVGAGVSSRIAEINHLNHTLNGFTIDGLHGDPNSVTGYREKLIYAQGKLPLSGVNGLRILNMKLANAKGECVRLRYFARNNEIAYNTILNCGVEDYKFSGGTKNGEGIYIGTAPEQRADGRNPTTDVDASKFNWVHHNVIDTQGNECVNIKEGASENIVENNSCTGQKDPSSAGLDSRGSNNYFRSNEVFGNVGAGIRFGGDTPTDARYNEVRGNIIYNNLAGGIKMMATPQGLICNNVMNNNTGGNAVGTYKTTINPTMACPVTP